ncbi:MAG: alpha/beta hydrolase [Actinomycetota bacterium]|nr:alpha/beta hydrolase [Actinomycetota bacterium]
MSLEGSPVQSEGRYVHANGIDIYYIEAGRGEPLLLLHGGVVSTNSVWAGHPWAYVSHMDTLAEHFRVIAPDTRGHGRTINAGGGSISYTQLADDVVELIDALGLDRPMICGFSDGGMTATITGIRHPGSVRAIVNHAGYDTFNPQAPSMPMMRQNLGGSPDATQADPDVIAQAFESSEQMRAMFELVKADHDGAQGAGYWKTHFAEAFDRFTQPPGYTMEDLQKITAPTLILTGDRDEFCTVEEGVAAYRILQQGELAVLPNHAHVISPSVVQATIEFLERHQLAR